MSDELPEPKGQFLLYASDDGQVKVECRFHDETIWLTQKLIADLFGVGIPAINKHLKNIFESGELDESSVVSILEITAADGKNYQTRFYNLDAIIAVGYRVNSYQATQFRIWATKTLREFLIKGFVMDDERLKQGGRFSERITSTSCWSASGKSGRASGGFTRRSRTFTRWRSTTTGKHH